GESLYDAYVRTKAESEASPLFSNAPAVGSPEFRQWFGDSKVVDASGEPLVVYHGTRKAFSVFRPSGDGNFGPGIYLSPDKSLAKGFGNKVIAAHVSMKNPARRDVAMEAYNATGGDRFAVQKWLEDRGHDGIWVGDEIVAF